MEREFSENEAFRWAEEVFVSPAPLEAWRVFSTPSRARTILSFSLREGVWLSAKGRMMDNATADIPTRETGRIHSVLRFFLWGLAYSWKSTFFSTSESGSGHGGREAS